MRKRVPLNAIRAFEATARNASVVKAADELCVTPTAVSHQIRQLEEFLQTELFLRRNARMELTPEARASVAGISRALDLINDAVAGLLGTGEEREKLTVMASASVTSLWLMPRLGAFLRYLPGIDVNVRTFLSRREAEAQEADLRICNWHSTLDCRIEPLLEEEIAPLASPALVARHGSARATLAEAPLLHVDRAQDGTGGTYPDWAPYLDEYGMMRADVHHGARFNTAGTAMEAALEECGIILGRSILTDRAVRAGRLVPLGDPYPVRSPYYLLSPWKVGNSALQSLRDWLLRDARPADVRPAMPTP